MATRAVKGGRRVAAPIAARRTGSARRRRPRGRVLVAAALVAFVLVAMGVIWRRSFGTVQRAEIERMEAARATLEARKATLQRQIRLASSQSRLVPIAEQRLQMRFPDDSQVLIVERPARASAAGGAPATDPARRAPATP